MLLGIAKTDTDVAAVRCEDRGVDTDQFAVQVNQRTTGVTTVDRCIGLDEVFVVFGIQSATPQRRDNPGSYRLSQPNGLPIATV